jgi:hypothetical protein
VWEQLARIGITPDEFAEASSVARRQKRTRSGSPSVRPYYVQTGSMFDNPHGVPPAEVIRMIVENPPEVTAQTVFGKYVESSGLVFLGELIEMMIDRRWKRVVGNAWVDGHAANQAHHLPRAPAPALGRRTSTPASTSRDRPTTRS